MKRTSVTTVSGATVYPQFSEQEILDLQDLFLTYGCNYLTVPTMGQGREIISLFLASFQCFSRTACLTTQPALLDDSVVRLHDELALDGALAFDHHRLDDFLLNKFYYDFLWIECSDDLIQAPWFYYFEKKLIDYNIAQSMPILFVSYKDTSI